MSSQPSIPRIPLQRTAPESGGRPRRGRRRPPLASAPLGSLTQREHRVVVECRACRSPHVTRLTISLTDGTPVDFTSCHRCEHRSWEHQGAELTVEGVLDRTRLDRTQLDRSQLDRSRLDRSRLDRSRLDRTGMA